MSEFYVILSSGQGGPFYTDNVPHSFKVKLNRPLEFKQEGWKVSLVQYRSTVRTDVLVCSNICSYTIVGAGQHRVLRFMPSTLVGQHFVRPHYIPVSAGYIDTVHIYLLSPVTGEVNRTEASNQGVTYAVLHFAYMP
jgi:hypothetical protein